MPVRHADFGTGGERGSGGSPAYGTGGSSATGTGGADDGWQWGEPLISENGNFTIERYDGRLIAGSWEALRIEESSPDLKSPFTVEFLSADPGVSAEVVVGEPFHFHGITPGRAKVRFRATDDWERSIEDAFWFNVEEPRSITMGTCDRMLAGFGTDVGFYLNDRLGFYPQDLLPVSVSVSASASVQPIDGYLASRFGLVVKSGFVGSLTLESTLADGSQNTLRAIDPLELLPPKLFGAGTAGVGKLFQISAQGSTAEGQLCSPLPIIVTASAASTCRVVEQLPAQLYHPYGPVMYQVVGDVIGGLCEFVVQYDTDVLEAVLGAEVVAKLSADVLAPVTIALDIDIVQNPPPGSEVKHDGGGGASGSGTSGGGWGD